MGRSHDGETRQQRLEEALRRSEERYERLVEAAKDYAIFMTDADRRVSTWNEGPNASSATEKRRSSARTLPCSSRPRTASVVSPSDNCRRPEPRAGPKTSAGICATTDRASGSGATCRRLSVASLRASTLATSLSRAPRL